LGFINPLFRPQREELIGTTQELSLGTAAVAHLGAAARVLDYPCDNSGLRLYVDDVVSEPVRYRDGYLHVPAGPGLGMQVDAARVEALSARPSGRLASAWPACSIERPARGRRAARVSRTIGCRRFYLYRRRSARRYHSEGTISATM
jgi:hypothetical protein